METKKTTKKTQLQTARDGVLLSSEGTEIQKGCWENGVYLGSDGFVYHLTAANRRGGIHLEIASKRPVGEYLRWVDGVYRPGTVPDRSNAVHYRAARALRELL